MATFRQNVTKFLNNFKKNPKEEENVLTYLCRVEEARRWLGVVLEKEMPPIAEFESSLLNGVVLCKLGRKLAPEIVQNIHDEEETIYKAKGVVASHTANLRSYLEFLNAYGLPEVFVPSDQSLLVKREAVKIIFSLHSLSYFCVLKNRVRTAVEEITEDLELDLKLRKRCAKHLSDPSTAKELAKFVALEDFVQEELQYEAIIEFDCDTVDSLPSPLLSQQDSKTDEDHDGYETIPEVQLESLPGAPVADLPCAKNGVYALVYLSKTKPKVPTLKDGALFVINMAVQRRDQEALHQALSNPQAELPYIHQKWSETYLHALVEEERARMPTSILCLYRGLNRETSEELMERMTPGAFLLRQAPHEKIVFSFRNQAGIKHWKMIERERKFYMSFNNPSESYDSIGELLEHFIPLLEAKTRVPVHIGTCPDLHLVGWERVPILKELSKEESHLTHEQITSVVNSVNGRIQKERVGSMEVANTREMDAVDWNDRMILNVTRMGADLLLTKHGRPGNFIVRPSLSSTNDFAIGFKTVQDICHWKVTRLDGHFIIKPRPHKYNSLNQVINAFVHQVQEVTGIEKWEHLSIPQETVELLLDYSLVNKKEKKVTKQEDHLRYPHLAGRSEWREEEEEGNPANEAKRYSWAFCQLSQGDDLSIVGPWTMSKENGHTPHTPLVAEVNVEPRFYSLERMRKRGNYTKRLREVQPILDSEPCNRTSLSQLNPANVASWSRDDVAQWLIDNNLQKFVDVFKTNEVDGECLLSLDHTQLKEDLGIAALGHRHKIMKLIRKLGGQNAPPRFGQTPPNTPS